MCVVELPAWLGVELPIWSRVWHGMAKHCDRPRWRAESCDGVGLLDGGGIDGELYWDTIFAYPNSDQAFPSSWGGTLRPDPWSRQTPTGLNAGGSGDGNLFSPGLPSLIGGASSIPVESVRLKSIRDGVEDNELLRIAERQLGRAQVAAMIRPFIRSAWDFEAAQQSVMQSVRQLIGRRLTTDDGTAMAQRLLLE